MCTDGLACGQHGGFELLEAISAYKYTMPGISNVAVRSGPCEGVCPRDKCTVALRCPDQRLRTVKAVPAGSVVAALTAQEQAVDQQSVKREAAFSDALLGSGSGSTEAPSNLSAQSQFSPQSTAPAMLFEGSIDDDSNDNNGNDLEALSAKLIAQKLSNILGTSIGADADQDAPSAADWSDAMSWSEAAAKLVFAECGTMVPPLLVVAHQAKHFGDLAAKQTNFRDAEKLYNLAIEHCPTRVFEPAWETEEEETARRALRSLAGSLWVESRHNSLLTLVIKDDFLVESFRESSGSYCRGSAALIDVSVEADGLLKGTWMEGSGSGSFQLQVYLQLAFRPFVFSQDPLLLCTRAALYERVNERVIIDFLLKLSHYPLYLLQILLLRLSPTGVPFRVHATTKQANSRTSGTGLAFLPPARLRCHPNSALLGWWAPSLAGPKRAWRSS